MTSLFNAYSTALFVRTGRFVVKCSSCGFSAFSSSLASRFEHVAAIRSVNYAFLLKRFCAQCFSSSSRRSRSSGSGRGSGSGSSSSSKTKKSKLDSKPALMEEKNAFFVVRKGDIVGIYKNLSECQSQVGSSVCDPPVSVYKGYTMPKEAEEYMLSCGLKNALYSIRAADLTEDLFGSLVPCPFQAPFGLGATSTEHPSKRRMHEVLGPQTGEALALVSISNDDPRKHAKLEHHVATQAVPSGRGCILEFDGASKGNPGPSGAGAVLRTDDGNLICRLREGLGIATNNVAEYRAIVLGLRYALSKGFTNIRVLGDSKLVCMQVQGLWKVKNQNISRWYEEVKKLKDKFICFQITHVLRDFNSEADAQANLAVDLAAGQIQEEVDK